MCCTKPELKMLLRRGWKPVCHYRTKDSELESDYIIGIIIHLPLRRNAWNGLSAANGTTPYIAYVSLMIHIV